MTATAAPIPTPAEIYELADEALAKTGDREGEMVGLLRLSEEWPPEHRLLFLWRVCSRLRQDLLSLSEFTIALEGLGARLAGNEARAGAAALEKSP